MTERPTSFANDLPNCCRITEEIYERRLPDGVSIEQLVARWNAVQNYDTTRLVELHGEFGRGWQSCIHHLRQEPPQ